jgi:hypothetical protein
MNVVNSTASDRTALYTLIGAPRGIDRDSAGAAAFDAPQQQSAWSRTQWHLAAPKRSFSIQTATSHRRIALRHSDTPANNDTPIRYRGLIDGTYLRLLSG